MKMKKKWIRMLALFATLLALPLTGQAVEGQQEMLDPAKKCTLTIKVDDETPGPGQEFQANVSFDLYQVAGIWQTPGHDGYEYVPSADSLTGAETVIERANSLLLAEGKASAEDTMELASDTARLVSEAAPEKGFVSTQSVTYTEGKAQDVSFEGLDAGLYLVIARGSNLNIDDRTDYFFETAKSDDPGDPDKYMATMAYSDTQVYTFQAMLVTLPGLTPNTDIATMENLPWTYPWVYNADVILKDKYEKTDRYASLDIQKNLTDFKEGAGVTFLFSVEATKDGASVYSDVIPVSFDSAGQGSARIDRIPVGADVVITEAYAGIYQQTGTASAGATLNRPGDEAVDVNYTTGANSITIPNITGGNISIGSGEDQTTVNAGNTVTVSFTNAYSGSGNNGGSVVNSFNKDENGGWTLDRTYADSNGVTENTVQGTPVIPPTTDGPVTTDNPGNEVDN